MAKKTAEEKLADKITEAIHDTRFDYTLLANLLVNNNTLYAQDQIMELIKAIIEQQDRRFQSDWEHGQTSAGTMLAAHLAEIINIHKV